MSIRRAGPGQGRVPAGERGYWVDGEWHGFDLVGDSWEFRTPRGRIWHTMPAIGRSLHHLFRDPQLARMAALATSLDARMGTMGGQYSVSTGKVASGALAAGAAKTMILLNPATDGGSLAELWLSYGANASQTDIAYEVDRTSTLGSPVGTTATVNKDNPGTGAATWTGLTALSTEPTSYLTLREIYLPVNQGFVIMPWPLGREPFAAAAGARLGVRIINDEAGAMTSVDARQTAVWVEE